MAEAWNPQNPDDKYEVPGYLEGIFTVWSFVGPAGLKVLAAHDYSDAMAEGFTDEDDVEYPADNVLGAWLDSAVELPEDWDEYDGNELVPVAHDGKSLTNHDIMVVAINALAALNFSIRGRLDDFDGLPDWLA